MNIFENVKLTCFRRDGKTPVVALEMNNPLTKLEVNNRGETLGLRWISFYFEYESELKPLLLDKISACVDIGHNVSRFGGLFRFYDLDFPNGVNGVANIKYCLMPIPDRICKVLVRYLDMIFKFRIQEGSDDRIDFPIALSHRNRWCRVYGIGTGKAIVDCWSDVTDQFFLTCSNSPGFLLTINRLLDSTRNTTQHNLQVARLVLSKDGEGFYFRIVNHFGRCVMRGGVINHSGSWSTHT